MALTSNFYLTVMENTYSQFKMIFFDVLKCDSTYNTAVDMVVPKSFPALCTPYVQVVHQPWKCTVHKSWKCLHRWSVQEVSKSCKKCFVSKSVSKSVLHNSYVITVSKKCPSRALSKLGPNLTHARDTSCGCGFDYFKDGVLSLFGEVLLHDFLLDVGI